MAKVYLGRFRNKEGTRFRVVLDSDREMYQFLNMETALTTEASSDEFWRMISKGELAKTSVSLAAEYRNLVKEVLMKGGFTEMGKDDYEMYPGTTEDGVILHTPEAVFIYTDELYVDANPRGSRDGLWATFTPHDVAL